MRQIKTFILHLYTDLELHEKTCGNLQALPGRKTHPFKDDSELFDLLQRLTNEEVKYLPERSSHNQNDPNFSNSEQPVK